MHLSPVQLLDSTIERIRIDQVLEANEAETDLSKFLLFYRHAEPATDYWDESDEVPADVKSRTFRVRLGLKTKDDLVPVQGYRFEVVASAYLLVLPEQDPKHSPEDMAAKFGLTMLFGAIREILTTNTARMRHGKIRLPAFTFSDTKFEDLVSAQDSSPPKAIG